MDTTANTVPNGRTLTLIRDTVTRNQQLYPNPAYWIIATDSGVSESLVLTSDSESEIFCDSLDSVEQLVSVKVKHPVHRGDAQSCCQSHSCHGIFFFLCSTRQSHPTGSTTATSRSRPHARSLCYTATASSDRSEQVRVERAPRTGRVLCGGAETQGETLPTTTGEIVSKSAA